MDFGKTNMFFFIYIYNAAPENLYLHKDQTLFTKTINDVFVILNVFCKYNLLKKQFQNLFKNINLFKL